MPGVASRTSGRPWRPFRCRGRGVRSSPWHWGQVNRILSAWLGALRERVRRRSTRGTSRRFRDLLGVRRAPPRVVWRHAVRSRAHRGKYNAVDHELGQAAAEIGLRTMKLQACAMPPVGARRAAQHSSTASGQAVRVRADTASRANGVIYVQRAPFRGNSWILRVTHGDHRDVFGCRRTRRSGQRSVIWYQRFPEISTASSVNFCAMSERRTTSERIPITGYSDEAAWTAPPDERRDRAPRALGHRVHRRQIFRTARTGAARGRRRGR